MSGALTVGYRPRTVSRRDVKLLLGLVALALAWTLARNVAGVGEGLELLGPALLFALPLLAGRYVGEDLLVRIARAVPPPRRTRVRAVIKARRSPRPALRGGLLLASHLAHRPPPALG